MKAALIQAAWAAASKKDCYWHTKYRKLRFRLGGKKAVIAIARKMLVVCYYVLKKKSPYKELGADYVDKRLNEKRKKYYTKQLQGLGFDVSLTETIA